MIFCGFFNFRDKDVVIFGENLLFSGYYDVFFFLFGGKYDSKCTGTFWKPGF